MLCGTLGIWRLVINGLGEGELAYELKIREIGAVTSEEMRREEGRVGGVGVLIVGKVQYKCDDDGSSPPSMSRVAPPVLSQLEAQLASQSFTANVGAATSTSSSADPDPVLNSFNKMIPPHKWNIQKFTGDSEWQLWHFLK
ncbi:hypothetical protein JTB14_025483 [Gonioctena quinquepunctata]|nr:hypothetical protein JTB14_025483 [Gonioctena quinquepunctata]